MPAKAVIPRAALAGGIGGLVAFGVARVVAEPLIGRAVDYEEGRGEAEDALAAAAGQPGHDTGAEIFSRTVQGTLGLGAGTVLAGVALGLLFAVVYTLAQPHVTWRPRVLALAVAGAGFLTVYATPFVKYPADPPAVGHEETIGDRSALYLAMLLGSVVFLVVATLVGRRLSARLGTWSATLVGGAVYVVLAGILMTVLPSLGELATNVATYGPAVGETPQPLRDAAGRIVFPGFDADLLYAFRLSSVTAQLLLWGVLGLVFGALAERATARSRDDAGSVPVSTPA
ncbi:CbtA family protein [Actinomycetospora sp. TBRC 11914]|uniref:CbtA family protein n=1 Tax=Actinomycetospora sp. TBRC 11914 TaxID=2729387 RepID=UPI00145FABEB|nr:CbtA family protein [Actinomycetospora sp. TBRC 11914]NMO91332.1 CbtA family protein [Actinomycetospora sp. TBRC 11914]